MDGQGLAVEGSPALPCVTPETLPPDRNPPLARPKYNLADAGMFMFSPKWLWFFYTAVKCI